MRGLLKILRTLKRHGLGKGALRSFQSKADRIITSYAPYAGDLTELVSYISEALGEPWPLGEKLLCALDITKKDFPFIKQNIMGYLSRFYPEKNYPESFNRIIRPCSLCGKDSLCYTSKNDLFCSEKCENQQEYEKINRMIEDYAPDMSEQRKRWVLHLLFRNAMLENWGDADYKEFIEKYKNK